MRKKIDLIYFNAGGGHRSAATALQEAIRRENRPWDVRLVNLFEVLDPKGSFRKRTGLAPEDLYNMRLKRGWTIGLATELKVLQVMIRIGHSAMLRRLERYWDTNQSDLVVSLVPNFNKVIYQSVKNKIPDVPYVTVLTDIADYPPHFWMEPGLDQHIVCGSSRAVEQAISCGYADHHITQTSGMILKPSFHQPVIFDRQQELINLGLDPVKPTGIVMFGGHGSADMLRIAKSLQDIQLIMMCGHNALLAEKIRSQPSLSQHVAIGFSTNVERYLSLGDFFIGKPGPGSISEAVHMGLPVITIENAWTMPQERYNTQWIRERGAGIVIPSLRGIRKNISMLIDNLEQFKTSVSSIKNNALYEVIEVLARQLNEQDLHLKTSCLASSTPD
ncbi:MAG: glycosyltransferase [Sheuella sp.]|nr:glycosyltransferase [Sheuella sp.]